jgi:hypothetical protein
MYSFGSTVVEHLPLHPNVKGSSLAADAGTGRENGSKISASKPSQGILKGEVSLYH